jgi:peptidoglycan/xylan/chitin deacetylase (PgdA/CDA1 family)
MRYGLIFFLVLGLVGTIIFVYQKDKATKEPNFAAVKQTMTPTASPTPTPSASPSAIPTPKPLTFAEMNQLYGPCVSVPILMFHHVEDLTLAKEEGHASLTVDIDFFKKDLEYLATKGYTTISPADLINFFDNGVALPKKPVMLTFDDGYFDNGTEMYQAMMAAGTKGTIFTATGLMNNPGYLSWEKVREMAGSGLISFGNHTWSHRNVGGAASVIEYEVTTADTQLADQGLNNPKIFAYPYGLESKNATKILNILGYKLAFSTVYGRTQCAKKRFDLPRIRVGNTSLSSYGL